MRAEPGFNMLDLRGVFSVRLPLGDRHIILVPASALHEFHDFQARLDFYFSQVCWEADASELAAATERAGFCRAMEDSAVNAFKLDKYGRPTTESVNIKRGLLALAESLYDCDAEVSEAYAAAGNDPVDLAGQADAAGAAAAETNCALRSVSASPWGTLPSDSERAGAAADLTSAQPADAQKRSHRSRRGGTRGPRSQSTTNGSV